MGELEKLVCIFGQSRGSPRVSAFLWLLACALLAACAALNCLGARCGYAERVPSIREVAAFRQQTEASHAW